MTTLLLLINYNSEADTLRLLGDLQAQGAGAPWLAGVVDNTAHTRPAPALAQAAAADPRIRYLVPGANLGYFGGAAWGLDQLSGEEFDWVIVSNTDIRIPDVTFLARLARVGGAAVVGPRIVSGLSHRDQNPYLAERPSGRRMRMYKWLFASHLRLSAYELAARVKKQLQRRQEPLATPVARSIYAPHGSFIAFHRSYFAAGGSLVHGTFLFHEEVLVAETARRLGLVVRYEPSLEVLHAEHATTSVFTNRIVAGYAAAAAKWATDTYFANDP
jgi:GT2 family glycosyltransferase